MNSATRADEAGYSPPITIELHLHGEIFNVASTGPDQVILRDARPTAPGNGIIRFNVDGKVTDYIVKVLNGIDPRRVHQAISIIGVQSEVAA
jgi:hypothetical protein